MSGGWPFFGGRPGKMTSCASLVFCEGGVTSAPSSHVLGPVGAAAVVGVVGFAVVGDDGTVVAAPAAGRCAAVRTASTERPPSDFFVVPGAGAVVDVDRGTVVVD